MAHCMKTWHHTQNRKYIIMYCIVMMTMSSKEDRATATINTEKTVLTWTWQTDRQTDTYRYILRTPTAGTGKEAAKTVFDSHRRFNSYFSFYHNLIVPMSDFKKVSDICCWASGILNLESGVVHQRQWHSVSTVSRAAKMHSSEVLVAGVEKENSFLGTHSIFSNCCLCKCTLCYAYKKASMSWQDSVPQISGGT